MRNKTLLKIWRGFLTSMAVCAIINGIGAPWHFKLIQLVFAVSLFMSAETCRDEEQAAKRCHKKKP